MIVSAHIQAGVGVKWNFRGGGMLGVPIPVHPPYFIFQFWRDKIFHTEVLNA